MIVIEVKGRKVIDNVRRIVDKLPKGMEVATKEFGESLRLRLKRAVTANRLIWRGTLHEGIRWENSRTGGRLWMPLHGIYIDSMSPHWVKFKKSRTLLRQWAFEKGTLEVRALASLEKSIFVKPHPFIRGALDRALADLDSIYQRHLTRLVESRGMVA